MCTYIRSIETQVKYFLTPLLKLLNFNTSEKFYYFFLTVINDTMIMTDNVQQ